MRYTDNQLALRPADAPQIVYRQVPHETQYVVGQTVLGESAIFWTAQWLAGLFCVMDFPAELMAYVQNVVVGPHGAWTTDGQTPFDESLGEVARGGGPFAAVADALLRGHDALQLALPGRGESTS